MTNLRFLALWGALTPVLTGAVLLVQPLGLASWTDVQTGLVITSINALSALVIAAVAHFWSKTTSEWAVLSGTASAFLLSVFALGNGFTWWLIEQKLQDQLLGFFGVVFLLALAVITRQNVTSKETVAVIRARAEGSTHEGDRSGLTGMPGA